MASVLSRLLQAEFDDDGALRSARACGASAWIGVLLLDNIGRPRPSLLRALISSRGNPVYRKGN